MDSSQIRENHPVELHCLPVGVPVAAKFHTVKPPCSYRQMILKKSPSSHLWPPETSLLCPPHRTVTCAFDHQNWVHSEFVTLQQPEFLQGLLFTWIFKHSITPLPKSLLTDQKNIGEPVLSKTSAWASVLVFHVLYLQLLNTLSCPQSFIKKYTLK